MTWLLIALTLQSCRSAPSLWPFLFLFWGLCYVALWLKGWV
jgi:hypothetical protein